MINFQATVPNNNNNMNQATKKGFSLIPYMQTMKPTQYTSNSNIQKLIIISLIFRGIKLINNQDHQ